MSRLRRQWFPATVLVAAVAGLVGLTVWGEYGLGGNGPIDDLTEAGDAADRFAEPLGLRVGEVMQFSNGFYAELVDPAGRGATEVLVDPATGAVQLEWGPAMTWNTDFGMMHARRSSTEPAIGPDRARDLADAWLQQRRPELRAGEAEAFPGYYTFHTLRDGEIDGMLSVHARTGAIWYHTWHGRFEAMTE